MEIIAITKERVMKLVYDAVDDLNLTLAPDRQLAKAPATVLFGEGSTLESLGLVSLIVGTEQRVADDLGITITLVNEKAMSLRNSPFRTVETLTEYVAELIGEETASGAVA
jgi:hypothetical protein